MLAYSNVIGSFHDVGSVHGNVDWKASQAVVEFEQRNARVWKDAAVLFDDAVLKEKVGQLEKNTHHIFSFVTVNHQVNVTHWQIGVRAVAAVILDLKRRVQI